MRDLTGLHTVIQGTRRPAGPSLVVAGEGTGVGPTGDLAQVLLVEFVEDDAGLILEFDVQGLGLGLCRGHGGLVTTRERGFEKR